MGFNSLLLVFLIKICAKIYFFNLLLYKKMIFDQIHIDLFYHIRFKRLLAPVFDYDELKRYDDLPKKTWAISDPEYSARVILVPLFSRFGPILRTFRPLLSQCSPIVRSFGSLDYSAVLL